MGCPPIPPCPVTEMGLGEHGAGGELRFSLLSLKPSMHACRKTEQLSYDWSPEKSISAQLMGPLVGQS